MSDIIPFDLQRLLWGDAPPLFLAEILLRIAIIWPWTLLLLRWIGGRSIAQLSLTEFLLVIALGSAVGDSLFQAELPITHAMFVIFVVVMIDKLVDYLIRRWRVAKRLLDGQPIRIVAEGRILCDGTKAKKISALEVMELLRLRGVENLGAVELALIEPSGQISILPARPPRDGLQIMPPPELLIPQHGPGPYVCGHCGAPWALDPQCGDCGCGQSVTAAPALEWRG